MSGSHSVEGTVLDVASEIVGFEPDQEFTIISDSGQKIICISNGLNPVRLGHRLTVFTKDFPVPELGMTMAWNVSAIQHDFSEIHPWFESDTAVTLLEKIYRDPEVSLPRRVLGDCLVGDPPFVGAEMLGKMILRSMDAEGTFFPPFEKRRALAPFTCSCNGILYGRTPIESDSIAARKWFSFREIFGEPARNRTPVRQNTGTYMRNFSDLWHWINSKTGNYQTTNTVVYNILGASGRPKFREDWGRFLEEFNLDQHMELLACHLSNPPIGFQTDMDLRCASAYLDIPLAKLNRLVKAGAIPSKDATKNPYPIEQMDLETYLEKRWIIEG